MITPEKGAVTLLSQRLRLREALLLLRTSALAPAPAAWPAYEGDVGAEGSKNCASCDASLR